MPRAGKTTFIKHLLGREYPGIHIGPEPTTDRFVVVMHGLEERRTPGNTLIVQPDKPYQVGLMGAAPWACACPPAPQGAAWQEVGAAWQEERQLS